MSISSGRVSVLLSLHGTGRAQLPPRSSSGLENTLFISTALRTKDFRSFVRTILSCGMAFRLWRMPALKNYISVAPTAKMTACDDSNFPGTRRKRHLTTSELIHLVGSVWLPPVLTPTSTRRSLGGCHWRSTDWQ